MVYYSSGGQEDIDTNNKKVLTANAGKDLFILMKLPLSCFLKLSSRFIIPFLPLLQVQNFA